LRPPRKVSSQAIALSLSLMTRFRRVLATSLRITTSFSAIETSPHRTLRSSPIGRCRRKSPAPKTGLIQGNYSPEVFHNPAAFQEISRWAEKASKETKEAQAETQPVNRFPSRLLSQISQLPQRDGQHRKIEVADGLKIGEHLLAASQCALVLRFPLLDERVGHFHLGAEYHN
jgi:hypothetical protein